MTIAPTARRRPLVALLFAGALELASCSTAEPAPEPEPDGGSAVLERHQLAGMDARQVIHRLDTMAVSNRPDDILASVHPDELVVTDLSDDTTSSLPMPDEQFYLSVAPYENVTHGCFFHSLTTCRGEMANREVHVTVTDSHTGQIILDENRTTYDNGFLGLWLPREFTGTLTVDHGGRTASAPISTGRDDLTCLTTMQLS